jgi:hypothetical protein
MDFAMIDPKKNMPRTIPFLLKIKDNWQDRTFLAGRLSPTPNGHIDPMVP